MNQEDQAAFYPAAFGIRCLSGQILCLTLLKIPFWMCVNKDLLDKEGTEVPLRKVGVGKSSIQFCEKSNQR